MDATARRAWIVIIVALLVGAGMAWAGSGHSVLPWGMPAYALAVWATFIIQLVVYVPALVAQSERFFDATGALTYIAITAGLVAIHPAPTAYHLLLGGVVGIWALRLGAFLLWRITRDGSDGRFDDIKHHTIRFLSVWTLQGLWVTLTASAVWMALTSATPPTITLTVIAGLIVWILGFGIEVVADTQKTRFRSDHANRQRFITTGLWSMSRHPNYLGEIILWVGVAMMAAPALSGRQWVAMASPLFVWILLYKVSGVPMLERRADERWGGQADYEHYKATTPLLVPFLGRK